MLKKFKMPKDKVLSTKTFLLSHLTLLTIALIFFAGLYYILYPERFQPADPNYNPVTKEPVSLFLEITSPEDDILVSDGSLVVSGKTGPNSAVVISNNLEDVGLQSDKNGEFSRVFSLSPGANTLDISVYDTEGNSKSVTKQIYFEEKER